jgi:hypothetical protein
MKLFFFVTEARPNKLMCLSVESLICLAYYI